MTKALVKKIDKAFSDFIRHRDTKLVDGIRVGRCCSSGKLISYEQGDAGHFVNRRWMPTRWEETNVHFQSIADNRFNEGNPAGYTLFMLDKYGRKHIEYLQALSKTTAKFTDFDGEMMLKDYRQRINDLR